MNYEEALNYIHCGFFGHGAPGLGRIKALLEALGNPQDRLRFIHVTGTNGKGSFCAMLDSVLRAAGYKTGLYTSPYIRRFNERMMCDGSPIEDEELAEITGEIRPLAEKMEDKPTEFELITAIAMVYFDRHHCNPVVLEVGMGGRLDATNIIKTPVLDVITGIALDHTKILGDTPAKIAAEKAGIFRKSVPVLWCGDSEEADGVIRAAAAELGNEVYTPDRRALKIEKFTLEGTVFSTKEFKNVKIPLLGSYQPLNAQNVLTSVTLLREQGLNIGDGAVYDGLSKVRWPARFEKLTENPLFICDGGHNPEGIAAAVSSIEQYFPGGVNIVTGVMADKNYAQMAFMISSVAKKVFCITPNNTRSLAAADYAAVYRSLGTESEAFDSTEDAVRAAYDSGLQSGVPTVCLGSLYMYGDVIAVLEKITGKHLGGF